MSGVTFWRWFQTSVDELASSSDTKKIVDKIYERLRILDKRLGVEVSEPDDLGVREVIITANGHQSLFDEVDNLIRNAPGFDTWRFISLKPPRGFRFKFQKENHTISPSDWKVLPLYNPNGELVLRVFVPVRESRVSRPILETMIETGIGERALAEIHHLEYTQNEEELLKNSWIDIHILDSFLKSWRKKHPKT
jgi:hypothetical protein